jgi:hypothetical protein
MAFNTVETILKICQKAIFATGSFINYIHVYIATQQLDEKI